MSKNDFEEMAKKALNMEIAIGEYVRVALETGESKQDIADRIADALYDASDEQIKITALVEEAE